MKELDKELVISEFSSLLKQQKTGIIYIDKMILEVSKKLGYTEFVDNVTKIVQETFVLRV